MFQKRILIALASRGLISLDDKKYLELLWERKFGRKIDWNNPKSFNEKLQWLKLYDRKPEYTGMVDKLKVKSKISELWGEEYVVPTLGTWNHAKEISYNTLPEQFVLKCTHDSASTIICTKKQGFDYQSANIKLERCLKTDYYLKGREWPYKNVDRKILCEPFLGDNIKDYKLMCFNGKVQCSFVCSERNSKAGLKVTFYDKNWNKMPFERHYPSAQEKIEKPQNYDIMIQLAEKVSENFPFVRVDFYEVENKLYFGELTLYPGNGLEEFEPEDWDYTIGQWLELDRI